MERYGTGQYSGLASSSRWGLQSMSEEAFTTKVLPGFGLGLLMAAAGAYLGQSLPPSLLLGALAAEFILVLSSGLWMRVAGLSTILYFIITLCAGVATVPLLAWASMRGGPMIVAQALGVTTVAFAALAAYGFTTKRSFANWTGALVVGGLALIIGGLLAAFVFPGMTMLHVGITGLSALFFMAFTVHDFQRIRTSYTDADWLGASLALFLDFMGLFTTILRLMGFMSSSSSSD